MDEGSGEEVATEEAEVTSTDEDEADDERGI